jgi:hypothetical protein
MFIHDLYLIKCRHDRRYLENLTDAECIAQDIASGIGECVSIYKQDPITEMTTFIEEVHPRTTAELCSCGVLDPTTMKEAPRSISWGFGLWGVFPVPWPSGAVGYY